MVITRSISFSTRGNTDVIDITERVQREIKNSPVSSGIITIFAPGSTGGLTTIEFESGLLSDFKDVMEQLIPLGDYRHNLKWGDANAHSHLRASLVGPSLTVPFTDKELNLGTWQQIVFVDFDIRPRNRNLILKIIGE
ncbi:MAG: secondary thiamine-phosphate synthase enzyme YjbQ [Actinomycetota bacterium]|nr:secondary thiamine-phosphate synthase enzyme YjbQ [Actinomycetota bacterium]MDI6822028.1 secondary thiamine-phosphate synthase enzyme YjbQ [Actinomycetota bacterium]